MEVDLTKALNSLEAAEKGGHRSEDEITCLEAEFAHVEAEWESLLLELKASKREVSSLHARASKDKEDMAEDYHGSLDLIFAYNYGCCAFKNKICRDQLDIPDRMLNSSNLLSLDFFDNSRCPLVLVADKAIDAEVSQVGAVRDSEKGGGGGGGGGGGMLLRNLPPPPPPPTLFFLCWKTVQVALLWPHINFICNFMATLYVFY